MKLLLVEDDENLAYMLSENLEFEGYKVIKLSRGEDVLPFIVKEKDIMAVLMDIDLAGELNGFDVAEAIRLNYRDLPIIFTTGKTHFKDMERGFALGNVDYQKKPFGARELIARLTNILRKKNKSASSDYVYGGLMFSPTNHILQIDNREVRLTKTEATFFSILCENINKVVRKEEISFSVWGCEYASSRDHSLNNLTHKIRKYLEGNRYVELKTLSKIGYRLMEK